MEIIDQPQKLDFKNGKVMPSNAIIIGYVLFIVGIFAIILTWYTGVGMILIGAFLAFTTYGTKILPEEKIIEEYTKYLGFIRAAKKKSIKSYSYTSVIPKKVTSTMYSGTINFTTQTDYKFSICFLTNSYGGKIEITSYDQKGEAIHTAKELANSLKLNYFEYDPRTIRDRMRNR